MRWWCLAFYDVTKPKGAQLVGGVIVEAEGFIGAVLACHMMGLSLPNTAVRGMELERKPVDCFVNRLLTVEEFKQGPQ